MAPRLDKDDKHNQHAPNNSEYVEKWARDLVRRIGKREAQAIPVITGHCRKARTLRYKIEK